MTTLPEAEAALDTALAAVRRTESHLADEAREHLDGVTDVRLLTTPHWHIASPGSPWARYLDARRRLVAAKLVYAELALADIASWSTDPGKVGAMETARTLHYDMAGWAARAVEALQA